MNPSPECFAIVPKPSFTVLYAWVFCDTQMSSSRPGCSRGNSRQLSTSVTSLSPARVLSVPSESPGWAKAASEPGWCTEAPTQQQWWLAPSCCSAPLCWLPTEVPEQRGSRAAALQNGSSFQQPSLSPQVPLCTPPTVLPHQAAAHPLLCSALAELHPPPSMCPDAQRSNAPFSCCSGTFRFSLGPDFHGWLQLAQWCNSGTISTINLSLVKGQPQTFHAQVCAMVCCFPQGSVPMTRVWIHCGGEKTQPSSSDTVLLQGSAGNVEFSLPPGVPSPINNLK